MLEPTKEQKTANLQTEMDRILILDDAPENCLLVERILKKAGYSDVVSTQSPETALEWLGLSGNPENQKDISLLLLDILLPGGMNGLDILKTLGSKEEFADLPVIIITAIHDTQTLESAFDLGAVDYVTKPFDANELRARVRSALRLRHEMLQRKQREKDLEEITDKLSEAYQTLLRVSRTDGLSGIWNRRFFDEILEVEWKRSSRGSKPISLLLLDIDYFKKYNDTYGHQAGDECIRKVAGVLKDTARRAGDFPARYGGEEFAIILPETDAEKAIVVAETIRARVQDLKISHDASDVSPFVSVSIGISSKVPDKKSNHLDKLLEESDKALYRSKESGRNKVTVYSD
ncbi:diguanylate cyclase [Leptospira wolffii]|uniref:diguanylate cyclase n=2 Tax=Leptospira wolffii TaxID=409998 RepID=A0A2M9Z8H9_9LEPT|nr:diguanylate cyclase response regulator [Leptospira wolffii]TGK56975.1 diguanylate cyclase [Leptospira wolffii]TGK71008.1 diguanylate cyclase [Leptospira wolffii]TGK75699.1 diguanylate cyclase [Leptospira wolffii]TGL32747.1 diguanylate cyclase [Leptospira wolffii]